MHKDFPKRQLFEGYLSEMAIIDNRQKRRFRSQKFCAVEFEVSAEADVPFPQLLQQLRKWKFHYCGDSKNVCVCDRTLSWRWLWCLSSVATFFKTKRNRSRAVRFLMICIISSTFCLRKSPAISLPQCTSA